MAFVHLPRHALQRRDDGIVTGREKIHARPTFWRIQSRLSEALARFPLAWNRASDKTSRQFRKLERILVAQGYQLVRTAL
jgi:hypothetical protein